MALLGGPCCIVASDCRLTWATEIASGKRAAPAGYTWQSILAAAEADAARFAGIAGRLRDPEQLRISREIQADIAKMRRQYVK